MGTPMTRALVAAAFVASVAAWTQPEMPTWPQVGMAPFGPGSAVAQPVSTSMQVGQPGGQTGPVPFGKIGGVMSIGAEWGNPMMSGVMDPLGSDSNTAFYRQLYNAGQAGQAAAIQDWKKTKKEAYAAAENSGKLDPLTGNQGPLGLGFGFGGLPFGVGTFNGGMMDLNSKTKPAYAYPVINGGYRPSYPVMGNPHNWGSDGFGWGQKHYGMDYSMVNPAGTNHQSAMYGTPGFAGFLPQMPGAMPWMQQPGMTPMLPVKGSPRFNPMGTNMPHPEPYNVGGATAINKYLGVKLLKEPYEGSGTPWVQNPNAAGFGSEGGSKASSGSGSGAGSGSGSGATAPGSGSGASSADAADAE